MEIPEGADRDDVLAYVVDAVETWKGSYHPEDPMFELDRGSISASYVKTKGKRRQVVRCTAE